MQLNRRNTLIGLGTLAVGGGALFSTGAFTTVEAQRDVNVEVAGDSSAFLTIDDSVSDYANTDDGVVQIDLDGTSGTATGAGLNLNAVTTVDPILEVTNNSENEFGLYLNAQGDDVNVNDGSDITVGVIDTSDSDADMGSLDLILEDEDDQVIVHTDPTAGDDEIIELGTGISEQISITIDTHNVDGSGSISDYEVQIDNIVFVAEADLHT